MAPTLAEVHEIIDKILEDLESSSAGEKPVTAIDLIKKLALPVGLAYTVQLPPWLVGVHKSNRSGLGIVGPKVHTLGAGIKSIGFSFDACRDATAGEDDEAGSNLNYTTLLQEGNQYLGKPALQMRFASLICSHLNQFLHAANSGDVKCSIPEISENGVISAAKLKEGSPTFAEALDKGLHWFVFTKECFKRHPTLPKWIQSSDNAKGQVAAAYTHMNITSANMCIYIYIYIHTYICMHFLCSCLCAYANLWNMYTCKHV